MKVEEFILARVAEWERWATEAKGDGDGEWASWNRSWDVHPVRDLAADGVRIAVLPTSIDEHVAANSPAHVLRQCAAFRRVVDEAFAMAHSFGPRDGNSLLTILASIWSDHHDFNPAWRV